MPAGGAEYDPIDSTRLEGPHDAETLPRALGSMAISEVWALESPHLLSPFSVVTQRPEPVGATWGPIGDTLPDLTKCTAVSRDFIGVSASFYDDRAPAAQLVYAKEDLVPAQFRQLPNDLFKCQGGCAGFKEKKDEGF